MLNLLVTLGNSLELTFSQWFLLRRRDLKLTQEQIATALGVTKQTVSNWENNRSEPTLTIEQVKTFCRLFQCTLDEIPAVNTEG